MKRIGLIRNSYSFDVGGAEIFPITLAKIITAYGFEPIILSANNKTLAMAKTANLEIGQSPWWSLQNFSGLNILLFPLYLIWMLILAAWYTGYLLKNKIDVVNPHSRDDFVAATFAARLLNKRVFWTDHADLKYIYMNHRVWYKNPVGKLVFLASKLANHVAIESFSEKRLIEESLGKTIPNNYSVIHIGILDDYKPVKRSDNKLILVSTSRLVATKGIGELIEAMRLVNNKNVVLKICGGGPEAAHFKTLVKGVKNIEFLGHIDNVVKVLRNSDVLVHPSYHEGFGLSLVEAEMCGLPIIACNVGSIPEIVKNGVTGILVPPKSAKDLAKAINHLSNNPKLRTDMGKAGRQFFLDNFQLDRIVRDQIMPLYNS